MRKILLILIFSTVSTLKADAITSYFYNDGLGYDMYYEIVLPPSYESNPDSTYQSIRFYLDCSDADDYHFYNHSDSLSEFLNEENINHVYQVYPGDHITEVLNGDRFPYSLAFIENAFHLAGIFDSRGELDGNGSITMADFILLLQFVLQIVEPTEIQQTVCDLNFNGYKDIFDLLLLADQL